MQAQKFTNHEIADTLDSSEAFEGPEKTLRLYFAPQTSTAVNDGLLKIPKEEWETMLDLVKCKVLSVIVHPRIHAYVLSESSLFIHREHIVLKTCGTTTLLAGLSAILDIVERYSTTTEISSTVTAAFYSRRSYFNPEKQLHPHGCWDDEVASLKDVLGGPAFSSHSGVNPDERWHLFARSSWSASEKSPAAVQDFKHGWLELMMTGLDESLSSRFHKSSLWADGEEAKLEDSVLSLDSISSIPSSLGAEPDNDDPGHHLGNVMTRSTGIDQLVQNEQQCIDSFAFSPCGYSCNGIFLESGEYFTIHVTPESQSYASFETSLRDPSSLEAGLDYQRLVERVLQLFEPAKVTLVLSLQDSRCSFDSQKLSNGKYTCTSEAKFDIGCANILQLTFEKKI